MDHESLYYLGAIITGAGGGIGRATALKLAREGAKLILVDFNEETLNETVGRAANEGAEAYPVVADVSRAEDVQRYVDTAKQRFGRIDFFHNNAGVLQASGMLHEAEESAFDKILSVNLKGAFLGLKYVLAEMAEQGFGVIVNGASHAAIRAEPMLGMYAATKHALAGLTLTGASEYGPKGIRINAVCPGAVKTR